MKQETKTTYKARNSVYQVDTGRWAEIVNALSSYLFDERMKFEHDEGEQGRFPTYLSGKGRELAVRTQVGTPCKGVELAGSHNLATLVLNEDGQNMVFEVHAHPTLDVNPDGLYKIGERFDISESTYFSRLNSGYYEDKPVLERLKDLLTEHSPFAEHEVRVMITMTKGAIGLGETIGKNSSEILAKLLDQIKPGDDIPSKLGGALDALKVK